MYKPASVVCVSLFLTASTLAAQESATLDFAWPAGSEAEVTITSATSASVMGQTMTEEGEVTYHILAEADGDGMVVRYSDFVFDGTVMDDLVSSGDPEDLTKILSGTQSDIRVDADGQFVGLVDYAAMRESMEALLAPQQEELDAMGMGGILDDLIQASMSEEALSDASRVQWNQWVGFWAGRTMSTAESVIVPNEMTFPILGATPVTVETELTLVGPTDCPEGSGARRCVEVASSSAPDGEELRNLMDIFMAEMSEQAGGVGMEVGVTGMEIQVRSVMIVDADTLQPLRIETTSDTAMEMDAMGMTQAMDNAQTLVTVFDWES